MTIRPEVVEWLISTAGPAGPEVTDEELDAALEYLALRTAKAEAEIAKAEARLDAFERADARDYRRWRAGHRAWVSEYGRRPVSPAGRTAP